MSKIDALTWPFWRRFQKDEKGVTAIEFALLAPIFFTILFSIFELGYTFTKVAMVNHAVSVASKDIYIGSASLGTLTYDEIEQSICDNITIAGDDCTNNLVLELTEISDASDLPDTDAVCEFTDIAIKPTVAYDPGGSNSTIFMRVCFVTDIMIPGLGFALHLPETTDDKYSIITSTAFVNEPF
jgi:hypothetical protein